MRRAGTPALALALALVAIAGRSGPARAMSDPGCGAMSVPLRVSTTVYRLPHGFLLAGTDTVRLHGAPLRPGADYVLDPLRGELRVLRDIVPGDTLEVAACWLLAPPPLSLQLDSARPAPQASADSAAASAAPATVPRPATGRDPGVAPAGAALVLSGNKTLAVDFGSSQDAMLRQSLDLSVSGTLAPGIQLTGVLSDRNLPLGSTGATQGLQSFDRVLLQLTAQPSADGWSGDAALGDIAIGLSRGEFTRLDRRVKGVQGSFRSGGFSGQVAAADAQGEYQRLELIGVEGRQGPYALTDRDGATGIVVVPGSDVVTVDGVRATRGEGADYSIDYERGTITFTNRRPISSDTRVTVDYQFAANRYRRSLAAASGAWEGRRGWFFTQAATESDDRGRPIDRALSDADRLALAMAGDSVTVATGEGVTAGGGDYDTVRVAGALAYAYVGPDAGQFSVHFAPVGGGRGSYADSSAIAGRTAYRFVGAGNGSFRIGTALPLPESHALYSAGGGLKLGALGLEAEGAVSRYDRNTFSSLDDQNDVGQAVRAALTLEGAMPGPLAARAGFAVRARQVGQNFTPFGRLEAPFGNEDWGLPLGDDLEHQRRIEASGFVRPRAGGELTATLARLTTPAGFEAVRRTVAWSRDGTIATRAQWERADGRQPGRAFAEGGREHARAELRVRLPWLEPALRAESDARRTPSDSLPEGQRWREGALELASPRGRAWHALASAAWRRDARRIATDAFADQSESRTGRIGIESPSGRPFGVAMSFQHRTLDPIAGAANVPGGVAPSRTRSDLGSLRLTAEDRARGARGSLGLEITSDGENVSQRVLTFVGAGRGNYDANGNFVSGGDYDLRVAIGTAIERLSRAATSAHFEWTGRPPAPGAATRGSGSRASFDFESDARRRGELHPLDPAISPGAVLGDPELAHGRVLQRLEADLNPESPAAALRLRAERTVSAERADLNYASTLDERRLSARWRVRPAAAWSAETEGQWSRRDARQGLAGSAGFARTLLEQGATAQLVFTPDARLRAVAALDAQWSRPEGATESTRTLRVGPDVGIAVGARGHADASVRRAFLSGPPPLSLLPTLDPVGAPRWEAQTRFDYRVHESATFGLSANAQDRPGVPLLLTGRAELRAFF